MTSTLVKQINDDLKTAMKARNDKLRVATLRLISAAIKDRDIAARAEDRCCGLSDEEVTAVLSKMVKQREDSAKTYEDAGRIELAEQERQEQAIVSEYLPRQLDDAEIDSAVEAVIADVDADGLKDMGRCMGELKSRYAGKMDFSKANKAVRAKLV
ncbi:GatB/YqeY domain-containing protein [Parvularcula oceani]|uniref:GatB/YqeY domain-containing protein n=1 Tax=Parvularcula oceani TaxID=1247963 RepID=UPI0004E0F31F|nr:GatB/YqeY domain-containing protein [Parvularcula oceani]